MIITHGVIDWLIENGFPPLYFWSNTVCGFTIFGNVTIQSNDDGDGRGYGCGYGSGYGYGNGDGYGYGSGYRNLRGQSGKGEGY